MKRSLIALLVFAVALPLAAQMGGGRMPGMRGSGTASMMMDLTVGPDGTVYVVRAASSSRSNLELAAVRPSGTVAWVAPLDNNGAMQIALNGTTVFISSFGTSGTFPNLTVKSQLLGFNVTTGAKVFANDLDGIAMDVTAFTDGAYVLETAINPQGMMTTIGRKLVSVSNTGHVNFTMPLD